MRQSVRSFLVVATLAAAFVAWPSAASADLTISSAKLDGVTSTSGPPGSVLRAEVTGTASGSDSWRGTQYRFGTGTQRCVDTDNTSGTKTNAFNVTAPGDPGSYDTGFTATGEANCTGTQSAEKVLTDGFKVTAPGPNPNLPPRCGINVMLVLDESGSIGTSGQTETVKNATRAFLNALSGTGAKVSIVDFSSTAAWPVKYTTVTSDSITNTFEPYLKDGYKPGGYTNWEDAFHEVAYANTQGTLADLVVFITDGDPTARNKPGGGSVTGLIEGDVTAMRPAAFEADRVKAQGSHVFALGVGAAVTKPASASRLTAVSGFDAFPGTPFALADYTLVQDFDDLAKALQQIATELCQASVTVTKLVDEGDGVYRPDPGWEFTATVATQPGTYAWLQPAPPPFTGPRTRTTDDDGIATFQWKPVNPTATSTVTLAESVKPGYQFVDSVCTKNQPGVTRTRVRTGTSDNIVVGNLGPNEYARCTVRNRALPGTIEIEKEATPQSAQAFAFTGTLEPFTLVDAEGGDSSSRIFAGLAPGTYTFTEAVPENWELSGVTCTDPAVAITGPQVAITLAPEGSVVCTYRNTRIDPTPPPEPPVPPVPPTPPAGGGVLPDVSSSTTLSINKTAPRVARVGQRIRFTVTVTNTGTVAATGVRVTDVPPAAVVLASLRSNPETRVVRGQARWRVGTLAPGESRTIRGSVRIKAGTPGLKRNIAHANAINAQLVTDRADTRLLGQRAPAVTG